MLENFGWTLRIRRVIALLEDDRRSLLEGRTDRLAQASRRREDAESDISRMPPDVAGRYETEIARIKTLATRNHRLLTAYLDGARDAAKRLSEIDRKQHDIGAYGRDGVKVAAQAVATRFRRA